jgi:hypothetical protein
VKLPFFVEEENVDNLDTWMPANPRKKHSTATSRKMERRLLHAAEHF